MIPIKLSKIKKYKELIDNTIITKLSDTVFKKDVNKKSILFIYVKPYMNYWNNYLHSSWANECRENYNIEFWGYGFYDKFDLDSLKTMIDKFQPDYIYMTIRPIYQRWTKGFGNWLPDLSSIKVPKIFV
jgi:hypothetical protein